MMYSAGERVWALMTYRNPELRGALCSGTVWSDGGPIYVQVYLDKDGLTDEQRDSLPDSSYVTTSKLGRSIAELRESLRLQVEHANPRDRANLQHVLKSVDFRDDPMAPAVDDALEIPE